MRALLVFLLLSLSLSASADLQVSLRVRGGFEIEATVWNSGPDPVQAPHLRVSIAPMLQLFVNDAPGWTCTRSAGAIDCERDTLPAGSPQTTFRFGLLGPGPFPPGHYTVTAEAGSARAQAPLTIGHGWLLGAGTSAAQLRTTIEEANARCDGDLPCSITFNDHPEIIPQTIGITAPLPVITACRLTIRSIPRSPSLPDFPWGIQGGTGEGLVFNPRCENTIIAIDGFTIHSFAGDGIAIVGSTPATYDFERLIISTQSRAIAVDAPNAALNIRRSTLGPTGRSGITLWSARRAFIDRVRIGVTDRGAPLPIGASGIFVGPNGGVLQVNSSLIAGARDFGIAIAYGNAAVSLGNALLTGNRVGDIDWGLDGPSSHPSVPATPHVFSATYDETRNVTRIVTEPLVRVWSSATLTLFANAHLEHFVGWADASGILEYAGTLRGRYVSAVRMEELRVSEVSPAVLVR